MDFLYTILATKTNYITFNKSYWRARRASLAYTTRPTRPWSIGHTFGGYPEWKYQGSTKDIVDRALLRVFHGKKIFYVLVKFEGIGVARVLSERVDDVVESVMFNIRGCSINPLAPPVAIPRE